jgi:TonB-dependent SusC/RagA subfamily outer membrane receptor
LDRVAGTAWVDIDAIVGPMLDRAIGERFDGYLVASWIAASALLLLWLWAGSWRLRRKAATWSPRRIAGHDVLVSEDFGPAVFGVRSPFIVVPRWLLDQREDTVALVCMHEAEHRAARDTALLTGAAVTAAVMPWNVALWWQVRRLRAAVELDCDQRVVEAGAQRTTYAGALLSIGAGAHEFGLVMPRFAQSATLLERRLTMLIRGARKEGRAKTVTRLVAVVGLAALGCGVPTPAESPTPEGHPSVFDYPPAVDPTAGAVPYRPVVRDLPERRFRLPLEAALALDPLVYVDGVRVESDVLRALTPDDIETVEIIKGAAAVSLYGPEASGGVITVVTKPN